MDTIGAFDHVVIFWNVLSSSLVVAYAVIMYGIFLKGHDNSWLVLLFLVCLYPALVAAYVAGRKWIEADYVADTYIYGYVAFSALCFLIFIGVALINLVKTAIERGGAKKAPPPARRSAPPSRQEPTPPTAPNQGPTTLEEFFEEIVTTCIFADH